MKQVEQNYRTGALRVVEAPAPLAPAGGVLVSTAVSLISAGTEKQIIDLAKASLAGKAIARPDLVRRTLTKMGQEGVVPTVRKVFAKLDTPIPLGYSLAGRVLEAGPHAGGFAPGDRVACAGAAIANHAELNAVPKNLCVRIPEGVSDEDASFVTIGAIALQGVRVAQPTLGERVVVSGLGLIGQLTVQLLKANGCRVLGFDPNPARAALALSMGADVAVSSGLAEAAAAFTEGYGADAVIVTASTKSSDPLNAAAEISRMKGRVVLVGLTGMSLDREPFYKRELDLRLSMSYGPGRYDPAYEQQGQDYPLPFVRWTEARNMQAFLELVAAGRVTPAKLVTHRFAIADAERAYGLLETDEPYLAILLTYPEVPPGPAAPVTRSVSVRPAGKGGIGVGFIGFGNYARAMLAPAVKRAGGRLTSVVTATGLSAVNGAERYGFANAATDPNTVIGDPDTEVVFIATRHATHAALTIAALKAGKHVFCEKPLAMTPEELEAVMQAADAGPGLLTVGFNRRFAPMLIEARKALAAAPGPKLMSYRINAGRAPTDSWLQGAEGGGRIIGEACHFVDALASLCGAPPVHVQAVAAGGLADAVSVLIGFADGSTGSVLYSSLGDSAIPKEYLEVFAEGRVAQLDDFRRLTLAAGGHARTTKSSAQDKGQAGLVSAFLQAVKTGGPAPIPCADLRAVTGATFAIEAALRTGGVALSAPSAAASV